MRVLSATDLAYRILAARSNIVPARRRSAAGTFLANLKTSCDALRFERRSTPAFEGTAQRGIWLDEEPRLDVYGECIIRTATTDGIVMLMFTPLEGMGEVVIGFLPTEMRPGAELE